MIYLRFSVVHLNREVLTTRETRSAWSAVKYNLKFGGGVYTPPKSSDYIPFPLFVLAFSPFRSVTYFPPISLTFLSVRSVASSFRSVLSDHSPVHFGPLLCFDLPFAPLRSLARFVSIFRSVFLFALFRSFVSIPDLTSHLFHYCFVPFSVSVFVRSPTV